MDYGLTEEQVMFKKSLRKFCEKELAPQAAEVDARAEFPYENIAKMNKMGLWGLTIPEEYGGSGANFVTYVTAIIEIARVCASTAGIFLIHAGTPSRCIWTFGTEAQKRRYLPPAATGEKIICWGQTEADCGSDATAMKTTGVLKGDRYILNGRKMFISHSEAAETFIVWAKTDPNPPKKSKGLSCFFVEKGFPGFSFGKREHKVGLRGSPLTELIFEDCEVPVENVLLSHPNAFGRMMPLFNGERLGNSSACIGIAEAAFEYAIKYMQQREAFGKKISEFQGLQWMLADMAVLIETAKTQLYKTARMVDEGLPIVRESCITKIHANEMSDKVTNMAMQLLGGHGYMQDHPVERYFRDCRGLAFGGGTPQILRNVLAAQLLKDYAIQ